MTFFPIYVIAAKSLIVLVEYCQYQYGLIYNVPANQISRKEEQISYK